MTDKTGGKEKGSTLSFVDWFLISLVVVLILVGVQYFQRRQRAAVPNIPLTYTLLVSGVDREGSQPLFDTPTGALVYSENGTALLGSVLSCTSEEHRTAVVRDGEVAILPVPERYDVYLEVAADAILREGDGLRVGDIRIAAGLEGCFRIGQYFVKSARILAVRTEGSP